MLLVYSGSLKDLISGTVFDKFLDFSCCPLSRVLHVTLANLRKFGFEFHLRSSPSALSGCMDDQSISYLLHYLLHRAEVTQQGGNCCPRLQFLAFSLDST